MSLFKDMLRSGETLFRDSVVLDYDFQPKIIKYRENEQMRFATAIRPLLQGHNGRHLFIYGAPGIGKTAACKHVLKELEEETDEVTTIYINCWKENTTFKIFSRICEDLGHKFLQNKKTTDLFALIKAKLNKSSAVFVFDEIDKLEEMDFLYTILEDIYRKSIFLITNYRDSYSELDERIRSRLSPEFLHFRSYSEGEITGILKQRMEYAFVNNCWEEEAFKELVEKCTETNDVRVGLYLMKETGNIAEESSSIKVTLAHAAEAIKKVDNFYIKPKEGLEEDLRVILDLVKDYSGKKIGDIFAAYAEMGGELCYKSFQRRINKLKEGRFLTTEKVGGSEGNTTIIYHCGHKKLTEF
ncbi:MAG: AAA family ATPase [Nanoarchaeota archaeon]|nr:AAA family ATPase [Nanoarchaeota archaeon]MBU1643547.1 AAA family ATPase [Nanoarchaeota archaeon]MBU1976639.1 AAA family ATPase [Nanoarchaeota archaeon]